MSVTIRPFLRRSLAIAVIGVFTPLATGACFGSFPLSKRLHGWNAGVSDSKWVREIVFLGTVIIPIRACVALVDMLFTNAVEFWTGSNPMAAVPGTTKYVEGPNGENATMTLREDGVIDVTVRVPGEPDQLLAFVREGGEIKVYAAR